MIINRTYFAKYSPLPKNFNYDEVMLYVPVAEKIWLYPILGMEFMDVIQHQIDVNAVSDEVSALLQDGGLYQYLCYATVFEALPILWAKFSEVGVVKGKSDNADSLSLKDMTYVQEHIRRQVEVLKEQVIQWICQRVDKFPLFNTCLCNCGGSCCGDDGLQTPNPQWSIYSLPKINTDLR